jgi:cytochrome c551/c552
MRRLGLALFLTSALVFPMACGSSSPAGPGKDGGAGKGGTSGSTAGTGGGTAGTGGGAAGTGGSAAGATGAAGSNVDGGADAPTDGPVLTMQQSRGQYLVKSVLGCSGCHTPQLPAGGGPDNSKFLAGVPCFAKGATAADCLNSANLTNDATGLQNLTDQKIKSAFTAGIDPDSDGGTQYLFAQMPYYQFAFLSSTDADAIVAYLRTVAAVPTPATTAPNSGTFATQPTAAQWTTPGIAALPSPATADGGTDGGADGGSDAGTASTSNGKYFAALLCSTCHTVNTGTTPPLSIDVTKAYQGGKTSTVSVTVPADGGTDAADGGDGGATMSVSKMIGSANLTPDVTGLEGWTATQIQTAIQGAKDKQARSICGMRALATIANQDALDIAAYLQAIPPVSNAITMTCY